MASWACSTCTFLNPPTQTSTCQVCLSPSLHPSPNPPSPATSSSSQLRWSCLACTFSNPFGAFTCEMCGKLRSNSRITASDELDFSEVDTKTGPSVGSVFLPLRRCSNKRRLSEGQGSDGELNQRRTGNAVEKEISNASAVSKIIPETLKILTYNVWFREDLEVQKRMKALGDLVEKNSPDFICFQEVTPLIYMILRKSDWWQNYECSLSPEIAAERSYFCMQLSRLPVKQFDCKPFHNSIMGRELCIAQIGDGTDSLVIATSHLESPSPAPPKWDQMYSAERVVQAKESFTVLNGFPNVIFCGDMNWDEKKDGPFPMPEGWVDPWVELRPNENGWTYDTKANAMLSANRTLQKRLDRFSCKLKGFKIIGMDMIGQEPIPGVTYVKEKKVRQQIQELILPVLPSDHYGLLMTIENCQ